MDVDLPAEDDPRRLDVRRWFAEHPQPSARELVEAGFVVPHWPRPYGLDADPALQLIIEDEMRRAGAVKPTNPIGIGHCGPILVALASDEQKQRYLWPMLTGDEMWCQLFSEPNAGSDLADLSTRAERDGDVYVVNGQKIWTSLAEAAKFGILIARTRTDVSKHRGISYFIIPMDLPGIEIRPIRNMTGGAGFNEVFFADVRVPAENLIGEENLGWGMAKTTLANERVSLSTGGGLQWGYGPSARDLVAMMRANGGVSDLVLRQRLMDAFIDGEILRFHRMRMISAAVNKKPGPDASLRKALADPHGKRVFGLAKDLMGADGMLADGGTLAPQWEPWVRGFLFSPALTVGGGTSEVLRNIISERLLGLPHDVDVEQGKTWAETRVMSEGTMDLDADRLVDAAGAAMGLDDFGGDTWREGLERFLADLDANAALNELGRTIVEGEVTGYLRNRLGIVAERNVHPEIATRDVLPPIVIIGQGRTGTTILHDLLSQDPQTRVPLTWETAMPCPPPETATFDSDPRIATNEANLAMVDLVIPGFRAMHPMGPLLAQECITMTASEFRSAMFPAQYRVPEYTRWLFDEADMAPAYSWHRAFLQHLQSRHPASRWVLKSPGHIWCLDALLAEYPDALLVQTHRDPLRIIASLGSLVATLRSLGSDDADIPTAAAEWAEYTLDGLDRSVTARRDGTIDDAQVIDVQFEAFMADPFATIRSIYESLDLELTDATEALMRDFLAHHTQDRYGRHEYSWAETELDEGAWRARARNYQEYFDVPSEVLP